ncbi:hypothetical protein HPB47_027964 [Ixodes persulcatus]|uniref:Uncharacterized protein n=1 Tax=Ixodes persulcatus TaxID=34615 RepID=A0AC60PUQ0_IXOPE|nr:hypothetical protein HPB47_027964 [Ixodes persulcatus]
MFSGKSSSGRPSSLSNVDRSLIGRPETCKGTLRVVVAAERWSRARRPRRTGRKTLGVARPQLPGANLVRRTRRPSAGVVKGATGVAAKHQRRAKVTRNETQRSEHTLPGMFWEGEPSREAFSVFRLPRPSVSLDPRGVRVRALL